MVLRRFNERGIRQFEAFIEALRKDPAFTPPSSLLKDEGCTEALEGGVDLKEKTFASRMEAAKYLDEALSPLSGVDTLHDVGLWSWLTLFFFDQVCPPGHGGRRVVGERARYIPAISNYQKYYRHLLAGPYGIFRAHRDAPNRALVLLCGPLHKPGEIAEQMVARQEIITNANAVELATAIYFDPATRSFKKGAAGKGAGAARRLADVLNQYDVTWDLYWMSAETICTKLPKEFDKFRSGVR